MRIVGGVAAMLLRSKYIEVKLLPLPEGDHLGDGNDGDLVALQNEARVAQVGVLVVANETLRLTGDRLVNVIGYVVELQREQKGKQMSKTELE